MLQHIVLNLGVGCPILKFGHIHIFQRELNPNLFRVDLTLGKQDNRLNMSTKSEHIPTKLRKYGQYLYNTNTARASFFPQNINLQYFNIIII